MSTVQPELVVLDERHADEAVALWTACGLTRPWNPPVDDFLRAVRGPSSQVLGLVEDERLLATALVGHEGHRAWVYYLAVAPDLQGSGLGRRMMDACEQWAHEHGMPKIQLMVRDDNEAVRAFYDALGYELQPVVVYGRRFG
ncbi:GNAT family acetyltransferase [Aestuariimicrobium ganziense]|uniref:GNAT family acetyltransferase n=1 Tax=Aestuariimicrobium ganziense TaxID=2773677 RepID=UPI001941BEFB|nr:GNAT family acetyltransferase [Aestuariimicrobium ganziense]